MKKNRLTKAQAAPPTPLESVQEPKRKTNRKRRFVTESIPTRLVPLKGIAVLGKTAEPELTGEGATLVLQPRMSELPDFEQIPYERWDQTLLRTKIRRHYSDLRQAKAAEAAMNALKKIAAVWTGFQDRTILARVRSKELGDEKHFYEEEYQRAMQSWPILEKTVMRISAEVLQKEWLEDLSKLQGKLVLLRLNAHYTLAQIGGADIRTKEKNLTRSISEQVAHFSHESTKGKSLKQADILLDDLLRVRLQLAGELGFDSFREYSWLTQSYFDYQTENLQRFVENVKHYLLPIHLYQQRRLRDRLPSPEQYKMVMNPARKKESQILHDRILSVREYYERALGEEDWELRHLSEYLSDEDSRFAAGDNPASPLYLLSKTPDEFFRLITLAVDGSLPRQYRGFLQQLGRRGYLRLDFSQPPEPLRVDLLSSVACPVLSGTYHTSSNFVSSFLRASGELYASFLSLEANQEMSLGSGRSDESRKFVGIGMEMMCLQHMNAVFTDDDHGYGRQVIERTLQRILIACMIGEFEEAVYSQEELSMSDRVELWEQLRVSYGLELYTHDKFWADPNCRDAILNHPFASVIRILPDFAGLTLWDQNRQKKKIARSYYETFCSLGASDTFLGQLREAQLPDVFSADTVKRLAYQIAQYIEVG